MRTFLRRWLGKRAPDGLSTRTLRPEDNDAALNSHMLVTHPQTEQTTVRGGVGCTGPERAYCVLQAEELMRSPEKEPLPADTLFVNPDAKKVEVR